MRDYGLFRTANSLFLKNMKRNPNLEQTINTSGGEDPLENSPLPTSQQLVYTADEAAQILKVNKKTVYRLVDRKLLHASNALRHLRITKKSLEQFLIK